MMQKISAKLNDLKIAAKFKNKTKISKNFVY